MEKLYIGLMSGTSLDGIDVSLCSINNMHCKLIHSIEYPFPLAIKEEILQLIPTSNTLKEIGILHTKLGHLFAEAINSLLKKYTINPTSITAIGMHGQTLWHEPEGDFPFSMQLGCPNVVHAVTNIQTVTDFRNMDIANGGQGAPLAPAFHQFIFAKENTKTAVVNIGGMANITILGTPLQGWDTGTGNVLLDYWTQECKNIPYDKNGAFAKSGTCNKELLDKFLADAYFKKLPPKSTGREYFNASWLANYLPLFATIKDADIQRTLLELTAQTITNDIQLTTVQTLIVCGGGAKNSFLMQRLSELNSSKVVTSEDFDISSDFMESMAFAWLAYKRINNEVVNINAVTGATKNSILGAIYG